MFRTEIMRHLFPAATPVRVRVTQQLTVGQLASQSVRIGVETRLGPMTRYFLFESYCPVYMGRPLRREDGSVVCCHRLHCMHLFSCGADHSKVSASETMVHEYFVSYSFNFPRSSSTVLRVGVQLLFLCFPRYTLMSRA
jgi:hypothetical protein